MNKKFLSAFLIGALAVASTSTFVSCKDYDDDIKDLQTQIDDLKTLVNTKEAEIKTSIQNLETIINQMKNSDDPTIAVATKQMLADAVKALETTITNNYNTLVAKNDAQDKAIIDAQAAANNALTLLQGTDGELKNVAKELEAALKRLENLETQYSTLNGKVADLERKVANLETAYSGQQAALEELKAKADSDPTTPVTEPDGTVISLKEAVEKAQKELETLKTAVATIRTDLNKYQTEAKTYVDGKFTELDGKVNTLRSEYDAYVQSNNERLNTLENLAAEAKSKAEAAAEKAGQLEILVAVLADSLRSLVYMPHLYMTGIETIEYPFLSDTLMKKESVPQWTRFDDKKTIYGVDDYKVDNTKTFYFGPAWEVNYHMNPANANPAYNEAKPSYYAYFAETIVRGLNFRDIDKNQAATIAGGITSPENYVNGDALYGTEKGIMKAGLQIKNPMKLWNEQDQIDKNVILALQARSQVSGKDTVITSDYAMLYPEKIWIEGLVWIPGTESGSFPTYWYKDGGRIRNFWEKEWPNRNIPNPAGNGYDNILTNRPCGHYTAVTPSYRSTQGPTTYSDRDELCPWTDGLDAKKYLHVWDSPKEALEHPADIEIFVHDRTGVNLQQYMGVHFVHMPLDNYLNEWSKQNNNAPFDQNNYPWTSSMKGRGTGDAHHDWGRRKPGLWAWNDKELEHLGLKWAWEYIDYSISNRTDPTDGTATHPETSERTYDTRYSEWVDPTGVNAKFNGGVIRSTNVDADGQRMANQESWTAVGREPLVRVKLYHQDKGVESPLLDGYIRLHINESELVDIEYPMNFQDGQPITFDLCNSTSRISKWSQFSSVILTSAMGRTLSNGTVTGGMERDQFKAAYSPEVDLTSPYTNAANAHYELVQYYNPRTYSNIDSPTNGYTDNGGDNGIEYYGYGKKSVVTDLNTYTSKTDAQLLTYKIGRIIWHEQDAGTTNDAFEWIFDADEMEALTHDMAIGTTRTLHTWIHFTGHFEGNQAADYDDVYIHLIYQLKRAQIGLVKLSQKINEYWFGFNAKIDDEATMRSLKYGLKSGIGHNVLFPVNNERTVPWRNDVSRTFTNNIPTLEGASVLTHKYYFVPREIKLTIQPEMGGDKYLTISDAFKQSVTEGLTFIITPRRGCNDNIWNKFVDRYSPTGTFMEIQDHGKTDPKDPSVWKEGRIKTFKDPHTHQYVAGTDQPQGKYLSDTYFNSYRFDGSLNSKAYYTKVNDVDEKKNNEILEQCAIRYQPLLSDVQALNPAITAADFNPSEWPWLDGVFSNDTLYAVLESEYNTRKEYEPIAIITVQGDSKVNPTYDDDGKYSTTNSGSESSGVYRMTNGGEIVLLHEYADNQWLGGKNDVVNYQPSGKTYAENDDRDKVNLYSERLVNAIGYKIKTKTYTTGPKAGKFIYDSDATRSGVESDDMGNPLNMQLRSFLGVIASNACNVAYRMADKDGNYDETSKFATFMQTWERPINVLADVDIFMDAHTNSQYWYAVDWLKIFDWRGIQGDGYMWKDNVWFWAYYDVKALTFDVRANSVRTTMNGGGDPTKNPLTWKPLSTVTNKLELVAGYTDRVDNIVNNPGYDFEGKDEPKDIDGVRVRGVTATFNLRTEAEKKDTPTRYNRDVNKAAATTYNRAVLDWENDLYDYMGLRAPAGYLDEIHLDKIKGFFGYIKYSNNGENMDNVSVMVPVRVTYDWGYIWTSVVFHIHYTQGNGGN